jgi:hypothetical protein
MHAMKVDSCTVSMHKIAHVGRTVRFDDSTVYTNQSEYSMKYPDANDVITGNGYGSRMVIAVNRKFPGPAITAYENQKIIVHMRNLMLSS